MGMSATVQWVIEQSVSLLTAGASSSVLPWMAGALARASKTRIKTADFVISGKLLATPILPCLVTGVFHAECLGVWVYLWQPCTTHTNQHIGELSVATFRVLEHDL
eukprot:5175637-Amphidinium_carterae.1